MRVSRPDGSTVHVAYCTNVHPATQLDGIVEQLRTVAVPVAERLGLRADGERLGVGLWFPAGAARVLDADLAAGAPAGGPVRRLREELDRLGLEVVTLNAFPYGDFHAPVVKHAVYSPDWTEPARLEHTLACARVLAALLPDDVAGGAVSTLPLAWYRPWDDARRAAAGRALGALARGLGDLERRSGRRVRVGLEPEPGCVWEVLDDALAGPDALPALLAGGPDDEPPPADDAGLVGVCLDTCHSAVGFDDLDDLVGRLTDRPAGRPRVPVVKLQASAALHLEDPADDGDRAELAAFDEPRFLHQVRERRADGSLATADDLPRALREPAHGGLPRLSPWRCHVHAPLHADWEGPVRPVTAPLTSALHGLVRDAPPAVRVDVVEVETYTWSVLPAAHRERSGGTGTSAADLVGGIAAELAWTRDRLQEPPAPASTRAGAGADAAGAGA
ncbi:metabolite traffic protein EboE [Pseudokineococcus sp. 5B2Z-1]|uniref:metabolite traffic protein EboE n=1 Tax=Pseudokineococcus sp. 5B2Z-1 TaxID=3132744 RepID=UPI0030971545